MNKTVLVADDEEMMRNLIRDYLVKSGFDVALAADGQEALDIFRKGSVDVAVLDVMMPKLDGFSVCEQIRKTSDIPVIILTARSDEGDELQGYCTGADEYVCKPFSPKVLVARIEALVRRASSAAQPEEQDILRYDGIELDKAAHVARSCGTAMDLSVKEFDLLAYFIDNKGIALSRDRILESVWGYDYFGDTRTVDTHVKNIRAKLGLQGEHIKTIWGMGYKFE